MKSLLCLLALCMTLCLSAKNSSHIEFFEGQLEELQQQASQYGKMSLVYFYASWCMPCQWMEKNTYQNDELADYLNENYFPIRVNIDGPSGLKEKKKYHVNLLPTILIFDSGGNLIARYEESMDSEKLLHLLKKNNLSGTKISSRPSKANSPMLHAPKPANIYYPPLVPELSASTDQNEVIASQPITQAFSLPASTNSISTFNQIEPSINTFFGVQVGAFSSRSNAETEMKILRRKINEDLYIIKENYRSRQIFKVIAGKYINQNEAISCMKRVKTKKIFGFVKKIDME